MIIVGSKMIYKSKECYIIEKLNSKKYKIIINGEYSEVNDDELMTEQGIYDDLSYQRCN